MSNKNKVRFKYVFNYNYNPSYVNGAQGGVSPRGEIVVHFYLERPPLPNAIDHEITPHGGIGREIGVEPEDLQQSLVRFIDTGVVMNLDNARMFHAWLGEKINEADAMQQAREEFAKTQAAGQA